MTVSTADRIVVAGHGIAGLTACDALRAHGFDGELTIVGDESGPPYRRPALSKALLLDDADLVSCRLAEPTHQATEIHGVSASGLDMERRLVELDDGSKLPYDGLVIATGSRARRLSRASPTDAQSVELTVRNLGDALALRRRLADAPSVVVVGGGPLGMEIASGCLAAGSEVRLISDVRPLRPHLGTYLSEVFVTAAVAHGLKLTTTTGPVRILDSAETSAVVTPDGELIESELVVTAAGDIPNVEWLAETGLLHDGVLQVDSRGRVRSDIVAVGDVAAFPTRRGVRRMPFWSSAIEQAKVAASALLLGDAAAELDFQSYFWTEQFGLSLKACGELPVDGPPIFVEGDDAAGPAVMRWADRDGFGTAVAINYRMAIPRLRRLATAGPALTHR